MTALKTMWVIAAIMWLSMCVAVGANSIASAINTQTDMIGKAALLDAKQ